MEKGGKGHTFEHFKHVINSVAKQVPVAMALYLHIYRIVANTDLGKQLAYSCYLGQ